MIDLKTHRKRAGLTQKDMARALGLSQTRTVSKWENNPGCMTLDRLDQYASACGVTVADLMGFDGEAQEMLDNVLKAVHPLKMYPGTYGESPVAKMQRETDRALDKLLAGLTVVEKG